MECKRIGIIGCGTIGRLLALHIRDNLKRQYVLAAVASRTHGHAARLGEELGVPVLSAAEAVAACDLVVETASADAMPAIVRAALAARPGLFGASSIPMNLEVTSAEATKGTALLWLCERLGVDVADTVAFGDSENDVSMLDVAGDAVAMENASPEVRAHARHVAPRCELAGVARYLEPLLA